MTGGVAAVVIGVFAVIGFAGIVDIILEIKGSLPLSYWLQTWARGFPLYSAALIALLGALVGHFFLQIAK
jgi:hypothetical protein